MTTAAPRSNPGFAPIAIVGRGCVLPGASTPAALWDMVESGRSALTTVPRGRFRIDPRAVLTAAGPTPDATVDRTVSTRGGYVQGWSFDDAGLALPRGSLAGHDPLVHWLCAAGRDALVEAQVDAAALRVGGVVGNLSFPTETMTAWGERSALTTLMGISPAQLRAPFAHDVDATNRFMSGLPVQLMGRALRFSLRPYALDAACASSLYALSLAARELQAGRADVMLAGAVNRADQLFLHNGFTALSALSPTGHSRPFDRRADGLLPAEGCALVALMRLDDAVAQRKRVLGVLRGVGLSNDGRSKNLLAPSSEGQRRALRAAYAAAAIDVDSLDFIECHATGTAMGDRTEIVTLMETLGRRDAPVPVSSLKGNLGHLITAAGAAGLLKVLSAFEHETLPPTIGCDEPLDLLDGSRGFVVQQRAAPWRRRAAVRRAGISAFGFGGNNAHAVVDEHIESRVQVSVAAVSSPPPGVEPDTMVVVAVAARTLIDGNSTVDLDGVRFPPNDLKQAIPQQLLMLQAARDAVRRLPAEALPSERTGVVVGMGTDVSVTTPGLRWRAPALLESLKPRATGVVRDAALTALRDAATAPLSAQHVLGCMPNVVANRVGVQLDLRGPGFVVSDEDRSGRAALRVAHALLASGELDACLVGAVDGSSDPRARGALEALHGAPLPNTGDAAICLVALRADRARALGLDVLWTFNGHDPDLDLPGAGRGRASFGEVHAANDLADVATGLLGPHRPRAGFFSAPSRDALVARLKDGVVQLGGEPAGAWRAFVMAADDAQFSARADALSSLLERSEAEQVGDDQLWAGRARFTAHDVCLVFGTAAHPDANPCQQLIDAFPGAATSVSKAIGAARLAEVLSFKDTPPGVLGDLLVASAQMQVHAGFVRDVLGVQAGQALGVSLGESNALFAMGAWRDLFGMLDTMKTSGLFDRELGGPHHAASAYWMARGIAFDAQRPWKAVAALADAQAVRALLAADAALSQRAFLLMVHASDEVEIGGLPDAVDEVVRRLGVSAAELPHMPAVHCPIVGTDTAAGAAYRRAHTLPALRADAVVWSHGPMGPLDTSDSAAIASAISAQAARTVDVPALLATVRAHNSGTLFVDLSPRALVSQWAARDALPRMLTLAGSNKPIEEALELAGLLFVSGVDVRTDALQRFLPHVLSRPLAIARAPLPVRPLLPEASAEWMPTAPRLPRILPEPLGEPHVPVPDPATPAGADAGDVVLQGLAEMSRAHAAYLDTAATLHRQYLTSLLPEVSNEADSATMAAPLWDRAQLLTLASGRIADVWGDTFAVQDGFRRQVRMPEPPLLLADRVMGIDARPGVLEKDRSIQTETDVGWDAWYLHEGRCPAGVLIETGQADLLLVSFMGVDFDNKGERVYRLLGCDLTYRAPLPLARSTLAHDIHVDGYANHGETRIFFFHSDTTDKATGTTLLEVRGGQAGFFSDAELDRSGGVLWKPADVDAASVASLPHSAPPQPSTKRALSKEELVAFSQGRVEACFGETHRRAGSHVRTPRIGADRLLLLDRVTHLDLGGGPWHRGYLRAELDLSPDAWFLNGHFKDDPCMPGTLMFEACLSTLAIQLAAAGFTLDKDGFLFEPALDTTFKLRCRGQATPRSRQLITEVFVKSVRGGDEPAIVADILCSVDGLKALHCADVELVLRRDWPLSSRPDLTGAITKASGVDAVGPTVAAGGAQPCVFDQRSLLATAIGRPSEAFPGLYDDADGRARVPRLPGPPYHFMSRVVNVDGPAAGALLRGESPVGTSALVAYDVPPDAWFFDDTAASAGATMPFSVLLEVALQPCGWVSSYVGSALTTPDDLRYRNLDGSGTVHREVPRNVGTLLSRATLLKSSASSGMIIQELRFEVTTADGAPVYDGTTVFGFFPPSSFERQAGVGSTEAERARLTRTSLAEPIQPRAPHPGSRLTLPGGKLLMIDGVADVEGAPAARVRTEKSVHPADWFFSAHFYEDPVQPGSLGIEAMMQGLMWLAARRGVDAGMARPRFESVAVGRAHTWRYRGQVAPKNARIDVDVELTSETRDDRGVLLVARAALWVDGLKIYTCDDLAVRVVDA